MTQREIDWNPQTKASRDTPGLSAATEAGRRWSAEMRRSAKAMAELGETEAAQGNAEVADTLDALVAALAGGEPMAWYRIDPGPPRKVRLTTCPYSGDYMEPGWAPLYPHPQGAQGSGASDRGGEGSDDTPGLSAASKDTRWTLADLIEAGATLADDTPCKHLNETSSCTHRFEYGLLEDPEQMCSPCAVAWAMARLPEGIVSDLRSSPLDAAPERGAGPSACYYERHGNAPYPCENRNGVLCDECRETLRSARNTPRLEALGTVTTGHGDTLGHCDTCDQHKYWCHDCDAEAGDETYDAACCGCRPCACCATNNEKTKRR